MLRASAALRVCRPSVPRRNLIVVIKQGEKAVRSFLGRDRTFLDPGIYFKIPILHTLWRVDMRERCELLADAHGNTRDNVPVAVNARLFYTVTDIQKAVFNVQDVVLAMSTQGQSTLRAALGHFTFDEITADRNLINHSISEQIASVCGQWGIAAPRCEIIGFGPQNAKVESQLEKQSAAERDKRSNILKAEGQKQAAIIESEAVLIVETNKAEAKRVALTMEAEALSTQLQHLRDTCHFSDADSREYLLQQQRLNAVGKLATGPNNVVYFMPSESISLLPAVLRSDVKVKINVPDTV